MSNLGKRNKKDENAQLNHLEQRLSRIAPSNIHYAPKLLEHFLR